MVNKAQISKTTSITLSFCLVFLPAKALTDSCREAVSPSTDKKIEETVQSLTLIGETAFPSREGELLFIPETGFTVLNPFYYTRLSEILYPILQRNKKGLITVSTVREARRLAKLLNWAFQKTRFSIYYDGLSAEEKREILWNFKRNPHPHYLVSVRDLNAEATLSHLTAYIDLDVNVSAQQQMSRFLSQKRDNSSPADVLLLINYRNFSTREGFLNILKAKQSASLKRQAEGALNESPDLEWRGPVHLAQTMSGLARLEEEFLQSVLIQRNKKYSPAFRNKIFVSYEEAQKRVQKAEISFQNRVSGMA